MCECAVCELLGGCEMLGECVRYWVDASECVRCWVDV